MPLAWKVPCIWLCHTPIPMPSYFSWYCSCFRWWFQCWFFSSYQDIRIRIQPDHPKRENDYTCDCDLVDSTIFKPNPDPSPPVIAIEWDHYNHCKDLFAQLWHNLQHPHTKQQQQWFRHDDGSLWCNSHFSSYSFHNQTDLESKQYACSISSKQMLPTASCLSRENFK